MQVKHFKVRNFKGIIEGEFAPGKFACLVGENNAGKSTVLQAMVHALGRSSQIDASLYYDPQQPIEFSIQLTGVDEAHLGRLTVEHREKIQPMVVDGAIGILLRYPPSSKYEMKVLQKQPKIAKYRSEGIAERFAGKRGAAALKAVVDSDYPEYCAGWQDVTTIGAAKDYISECIKSDKSVEYEAGDVTLPSGIPASIANLLPEVIYIPAVKNLADEIKTTQSTPFGRLLGLLLNDLSPELTEITESFAKLRRIFNRIEVGGEVVDERHIKVRELENAVEGFLRDNFPAAKVELEVPPPELKTVLSSAQIYVDDGSRDLIDNKGDGIKRSLTFSLLQTYVSKLSEVVEQDNAAAKKPIMFLFEEPELYLHPKSQRVLFQTLARISQQHQVVVTTHSPLFFAPGVTATFIRVAKYPATPKPVGRLHKVTFETDQNNAEVFKLAKFENADAAFFSRRVVLFEGESDDAFFKHVAKQLNPDWDCEIQNVSFVRVSGKGNFGRYKSFFEAFGIEVRIVADLDVVFDGLHLLDKSPECSAKKAEAYKIIDQRIAELKIDLDASGEKIKDKLKSRKEAYNAAKETLKRIQETKTFDDKVLGQIDDLFAWEGESLRAKACIADEKSRSALLPLFDHLRAQGTCVLSKGAIEQYYPPGVLNSLSKPERALAAASLVVDKALAMSLSVSLAEDRKPELVEICETIFG